MRNITPDNFRHLDNHHIPYFDQHVALNNQLMEALIAYPELDLSDTVLSDLLQRDLAFSKNMDRIYALADNMPDFGGGEIISDKEWDTWKRAIDQRPYLVKGYTDFVNREFPKAVLDSEDILLERLRVTFGECMEIFQQLAQDTSEGDTVDSLIKEGRVETAVLLSKAHTETFPLLQRIGRIRELLGRALGLPDHTARFLWTEDGNEDLWKDLSVETILAFLRDGGTLWFPSVQQVEEKHEEALAKAARNTPPEPRYGAIVVGRGQEPMFIPDPSLN